MTFLYILIVLLLIIIILLSIAILFLIKKALYLSDKEKEFIFFVMEMYIQYATELNIHSKDKHDKIVDELNKIRKKIENSNVN